MLAWELLEAAAMRIEGRRGVLLAICLVAGCGGDDVGPSRWDTGPGGESWNNSDEVDCASDDDCGPGEACEGGVCQMRRCTDPAYTSVAPLGTRHVFAADLEVAIVGDGSYVDGYEPEDGSYLNSWNLEGAKILDVTGGDFTGERPHSIAVAIEGSQKVRLEGPEGVREIDVGDVWPVALAAGDTDADGIEELVAFGEGGHIAVCNLVQDSCMQASIDGVTGKDVTVGDVDNDGFDEVVLLIQDGSDRQVIVWNLDADRTAQDQTVGWSFGDADLKSIAAADLQGDGKHEIVALHEAGWWDYKDDRLFAFDATTGDIVVERGINGHSIDVAAGDRNGDGKSEVAVLRSERKFEVFKPTSESLLETAYVTDLAVGESASRIAALDWNGDSASGRLISGPELVSGEVVPIAAMMFPPYDRILSRGASSVTVGSTETASETLSQTVSLHLGLSVAYGFDIGPIVKASVTGYFIKDWAATKAVTKSMAVGQRYSIDADPSRYGDDYGGVILSCGCFHAYTYETDDPADKVGGHGEPITVFVPVGGQTALWSTKRYNAMARALGNLPIIELPTKVGDLSSYPAAHVTLGGEPIDDADLVFPTPPIYQVSDIGNVGWSLSVSETEANTQAETTTIGMNASLGAFGVTGTVDVNQGFSTAYTIAVGKEAVFAGNVPPLSDNPDTPEDEYELNRYSFAPMVHREHYQDPSGEDAGFYVVSYAVGRQDPGGEDP